MAASANNFTVAASFSMEASVSVETSSLVDVMQLITALRVKHHPQIESKTKHISTVGLVVQGGCIVSAVVPGGPCDRDFEGNRIDVDDTILRVDGAEYPPTKLLEALVGDDIIGSQVTLTIQKCQGGRLFDCTVQRGALARIEALGLLFLMLSELIADIEVDHKVASVTDILRIESQLRVVESTTTIFLNCFKHHVRELEDALFDMLQVTTKEMERRTTHLRRLATDNSAELKCLKMCLQDAEARLGAAVHRESRRERTDQALQNQVNTLKIELEGSQQLSRELETQLKIAKNKNGESNRQLLQLQTQLQTLQSQLLSAQKNGLDLVSERDSLQLESRDRKVEIQALTSRLEVISQSCAQKLQQQLASAAQECENERKAAAALSGAYDELKAELDSLQVRFSNTESKCNERLQCCTQKVEMLQRSLEMTLQDLDQERNAAAAVGGEISSLRAELSTLRIQLRESESSCIERLQRCAQEVEMLQRKLEITSQELEKEHETMAAVEEVRDALQVELDTVKGTLNKVSLAAESRAQQLVQEVEMLREKLLDASSDLDHERQALAAFKSKCKCELLNAQLDACMEARDRAGAERDRLQAQVADLQVTCDRCQCERLTSELHSALEKVEKLELKLKPRLQLV